MNMNWYDKTRINRINAELRRLRRLAQRLVQLRKSKTLGMNPKETLDHSSDVEYIDSQLEEVRRQGAELQSELKEMVDLKNTTRTHPVSPFLRSLPYS
jgi:hypothetical protein